MNCSFMNRMFSSMSHMKPRNSLCSGHAAVRKKLKRQKDKQYINTITRFLWSLNVFFFLLVLLFHVQTEFVQYCAFWRGICLASVTILKSPSEKGFTAKRNTWISRGFRMHVVAFLCSFNTQKRAFRFFLLQKFCCVCSVNEARLLV